MSLQIVESCFACGACEFSCGQRAIFQADGFATAYVVDPILCNDCLECVRVCPGGALVADPDFAVCHGRGCPMISKKMQGWICTEGQELCDECEAVLWLPPESGHYQCPRCDLGLRMVCPKIRKLEVIAL